MGSLHLVVRAQSQRARERQHPRAPPRRCAGAPRSARAATASRRARVYGCDWLVTHHYTVGPAGTCEDMSMAGGRCMQIEEQSGCGDPTPETCADSFATVVYDPATVGEAHAPTHC